MFKKSFILTITFLIVSLFTSVAIASPVIQTRCGWIQNDMPNEMTIQDKDGEWLIMNRDYIAEGWGTNAPELVKHSNCGCMRVTTDKSSMKITSVLSSKLKPFKACDTDPALR